MTADVSTSQGQASHELVRSLSKLPTSDLVRFILQKPDVARICASSLNTLAIEIASSPFPRRADSQLAKSHVDIVARLIERGDPSLARKFVPTQGSLVDLAVASPPEAKAAVASVLERLLDATSVKEILGGLSAQLKSILSSDPQQDVTALSPIIRTLARLSSAFLSTCPPRLIKGHTSILQTWTQTCFQLYDKVLPQVAKDLAGNAVDHAFEPDLSRLDAQSWQLHWLTCRVDLLQLLALLLDNLKGSSALVTALRDGLNETEKLLKRGGFSTLLNSTVLLDLAATSDSWPSIRTEMLSNTALKKNNAEDIVSSIDTLATSVPKFTGTAWEALERFVVSQNPPPAGRTASRPSKGPSTVSEEVLAAVDSILPHYGIDRLRAILSRPSFAGQDAETVIQRLLEGDEGDADAAATQPPSQPPTAVVQSSPAPKSTPPTSQAPATEKRPTPSEAPSLVKSRANLFGNFAFDPSTIVQPKLSRAGKVDELAPELKAAILARAEAADDDEAEEEWNPFAEAHRTVGVEDELDLDYDGRERSSVPRRTHGDDEDEESDGDGSDAARMRERVLLRHYVQFGSHSFGSDASTRRSESRQRLKAQTGWSDDLIESWAVMLDRNPKKDRLLAAASQSELDEQLASRDHSRNASDADEDTQHARRFGPDRGRGGRILGGGRGGRGGGGRGGRGGGGRGGGHPGNSGGGGHGGGSQSKNATRGRGTGNSGTDRAAKQKEKAGNKARQKGHDKKMARVNP